MVAGGRIPKREPLGDKVEGAIIRKGERSALALAGKTNFENLVTERFVLRYAIPYLGKPHLAIVPGLVALDYGDMLTGESAWEFLMKRSNLHPRADVIGYRNDGSDEMIVVKWLDLAQPIQVFAYSDESAVRPVTRLHAVIAPPELTLPPRVAHYLPRFDSSSAWQAASHV